MDHSENEDITLKRADSTDKVRVNVYITSAVMGGWSSLIVALSYSLTDPIMHLFNLDEWRNIQFWYNSRIIKLK